MARKTLEIDRIGHFEPQRDDQVIICIVYVLLNSCSIRIWWFAFTWGLDPFADSPYGRFSFMTCTYIFLPLNCNKQPR